MRNLFTQLRDERGAAIIELALVAPVLALMTIGVVDMSNAFSRKLALEQGAHRAIEKIMQTTGTTTAEATIKSEAVCQVNGTNTDGSCKTIAQGGHIDANDVVVAYRLECDNVKVTDFDSECPGTQRESRYIQVTVNDAYEPMFPVIFSGAEMVGGKKVYKVQAIAGMRTA
jgi:Flp pilus assembly protein TadG